MQFLYDYSVFLDGLALLALIGLAVTSAVRSKSVAMMILAAVVTLWAGVRFLGFI